MRLVREPHVITKHTPVLDVDGILSHGGREADDGTGDAIGHATRPRPWLATHVLGLGGRVKG